MKRRLFGLTILMLALALPAAAGDGINSSIRIEAGDQVDRDLSTLNGKIRIGDGATVRGEAETVNGSVTIGSNVQVDSVSTVNGSIDIGEGTVVDRDVETVNGSIEMERGSRARKAGTVNGSVSLNDAEIEENVTTYNGDVTLSNGAVVHGDIVIKDTNSRNRNRNDRALKITIGSGAVVHGDVIVEDDARKVEVHLHGGKVSGEIRGAKIIER